MKYLLILTIMLGLFWTALLSANPTEPARVKVELISEMTHIRPGETQWFALTQEIEPGWHTYWRNPGDSGAATRLTWALPQGFEAGEFQWPVPEAIPYGPLMNYGYHGRVVLPVAVSVPVEFAGDSLLIKTKAEWLVCADICIPEDAELELTLPVSRDSLKADPRHRQSFTKARQRTPQDAGIDSAYRFDGENIEFNIQIPGLDSERIRNIRYFPYEEGAIDNPADQAFSIAGSQLTLKVARGYAFDPDQTSLDGIIVIDEDSGEALSISFEIFPGSEPGTGTARVPSTSLAEVDTFTAFLYAFLGGMILNLMPCVFPVLSIKVLSLVQHKGMSAGGIKVHGIVYLLGVVLSFVVIASILILLRAGGAQIGWGFQLQSPLVVSLLVYLFFVIGLNLSGVFQIGVNLMSLGGSLAQQEGYSGSFFTGVLATVVAAPCTAPFMGAAVGFALTQSSPSALLVFTALGLGMAMPYVLLCYSPGLLKRLPNPGVWMEKFKEFLAFTMYASAVWLIWVLSLQAGSDGVLMVLSGMLLVAFAIWLITSVSAAGWKKVFNLTMAIAAIFIALALPFLTNPVSSSIPSDTTASAKRGDEAAGGNVPNDYSGPVWTQYSPGLLKQLTQESPVFVNFTAAWCISCKVNEAVTLNSATVAQAFDRAGIKYLKGDWTNEDPVITAALAEYGRSGVPLYLLYPKGSDTADVLPQLLTEDIVLDAISRL